MFGVTVPQADRCQNSQAFIETIERQRAGPAHVASFRYFRPSMVFYGHQPVSKLVAAEDVPQFFAEHPQDAFLYTMDEQMPNLAPLLPRDVTVLETHRRLIKGGKVLLLGRAADLPLWPANDRPTSDGPTSDGHGRLGRRQSPAMNRGAELGPRRIPANSAVRRECPYSGRRGNSRGNGGSS